MKIKRIKCKPFIVAIFVVLNAFASMQAMNYLSGAWDSVSGFYNNNSLVAPILIVGGSVGAGYKIYAKYREKFMNTCIQHFYDVMMRGNSMYSLEHLKNLIEVEGYGVNDCSAEGLTLLYLVAAAKRLDMVKYLSEKGADMHVKYSGRTASLDGSTAVHVAIARGSLDVIKYFLNQGIHLNGDYGNELVCHALKHKQFDVAKYLIDQGVNFKARSESLDKAILNFMQRLTIPTLRRLTDEFYINMNVILDDDGCLLHCLAAGPWNFDLVKCLVEYCSADVMIRNKSGLTAYDIAVPRDPFSEMTKYLFSVEQYKTHGTLVTRNVPEDIAITPNYLAISVYGDRQDDIKWCYKNEEMLKEPEWLYLPDYINGIEYGWMPRNSVYKNSSERCLMALNPKKIRSLEALYALHWKLAQGKDEKKKEGYNSKYGMGVLTQLALQTKQDLGNFTDVLLICQK